MKKLIILLLLLLYPINVFSQNVEIPDLMNATVNPEKTKISEQLTMLKTGINFANKAHIESVLSDSYKNFLLDNTFSESQFDTVKINILDININNNKAHLSCEILLMNNKTKYIKDVLQLIKTNKWRFTKTGSLDEIISGILKQSLKKINSKSSTNIEEYITTFNVRLSEKVLMPIYHYKTPIFQNKVYEYNANLVKSELGHYIFSKSALDGDIFHRKSGSRTYKTGFMADPKRREISYCTHYSGSWDAVLHTYGNTSDDFGFLGLSDIDVNIYGELFAIDSYRKAIYKFEFNTSDEKIHKISDDSFIDVNDVEKPVDIEYSHNLTRDNNSDDYIVVADIGKKALLVFNSSGVLTNEFTSFYLPNDYAMFDIKYPKIVRLMGDRIVWYDEDYQSVFSGHIVDGKLMLYSDHISRFPYYSIITDIGFSSSKNIIASDKGKNMLHILNNHGQYICSYDGENSPISFRRPQHVSNIVYNVPNAIQLDLYVGDKWSNSKGIKKFRTGCDIFDIKNIFSGSSFLVSFTPSDEFKYEIELIRVSDNTKVESRSYDNMSAMPMFCHMSYDSPENGLYKWRIKYISSYDQYNGEHAMGWQQKELEFMHIPTLPANITSNTTLCGGNYNINANVTIDAGITLTVNEGANLSFVNNSSLIVNGSLVVNGVNGNEAIFDFVSPNLSTTNGIKINGSADIDYAEIKNGYYGIYANQSIPSINDCEFSTCTYPIYIYKSNYVSGRASIIHNIINGANNAGTGIYLYESSPYIRNNEISDFNKGIYCKSNSSPILGSGVYDGDNHFNNNTTGVKAYIDCNPFLGKGTLGGYNEFTSDHTYYIWAKYDCEIDAENNWWGASSPSSSKFYERYGSDIDYTPFLQSDPTQSQNIIQDNNNAISLNLGIENNNTGLMEVDNSISLREKKDNAINLYLSADYDGSKQICLDIFSSYPYSSLAFRALDLLWQIASKETINYDLSSFKSDLLDLVSDKDKKKLYGYSKIILAGFEKTAGLILLDEVIADYPKSFVGEAALFKKMMYYYHEKDDKSSSNKVLSELKAMYPESEFIADGTSLLKSSAEYSLKKETVQEEIVPQKYAFTNAYPNPFNPSTTIGYALPRLSSVTVKIYNIMGQKLNDYSFSSQNAGIHQLTWNGQNRFGNKASSGLYIIRFQAESLEGKVEIFQKSIKVIMLK